MSAPTPYLHFPGNCEEAFNFYEQVIGGDFGYLGRFKEMPPEYKVPPDHAEKVMHVSLMVEGQPFLFGSDAPGGFGPPFTAGNNVHLTLSAANEKQAKKWYDPLRDGGHVMMELQPAFWAKLFALFRDKYGIQWMISYGQPGGE